MRALVCILFMAAVLAPSLSAESPEDHPLRRKAAIVSNFAHFVVWPRSVVPSGEIQLCVLDGDPLYRMLDGILESRGGGERRVAARRVGSPANVTACHVLFLGAGNDASLQEALSNVAGLPVLTVGEGEAFTRHGGIVRLVEGAEGAEGVQLEIHLDRASSAGLRMSPRLLHLSRVVRDRGAGRS